MAERQDWNVVRAILDYRAAIEAKAQAGQGKLRPGGALWEFYAELRELLEPELTEEEELMLDLPMEIT